MGGETAPGAKVELAEGVKGDIAELTALPTVATDTERAEADLLKRRIARCSSNVRAIPMLAN